MRVRVMLNGGGVKNGEVVLRRLHVIVVLGELFPTIDLHIVQIDLVVLVAVRQIQVVVHNIDRKLGHDAAILSESKRYLGSLTNCMECWTFMCSVANSKLTISNSILMKS